MFSVTTAVDCLCTTAGHLEVIKFLTARGEEGCTKRAMDWAAGNGKYSTSNFSITYI
jgi:hypothetical protein